MGMFFSILAERPEISDEGYPIQWLSIGDGLLYALLGFAVTFLGIVILIFAVWLYGKIIKKVTGSLDRKKTSAVSVPVAEAASDESVGEEVRVAIVAAIAAYYASENSTCEFKVKRIKRL